jgi:hypothetical protein
LLGSKVELMGWVALTPLSLSFPLKTTIKSTVSLPGMGFEEANHGNIPDVERTVKFGHFIN